MELPPGSNNLKDDEINLTMWSVSFVTSTLKQIVHRQTYLYGYNEFYQYNYLILLCHQFSLQAC